MGRSPGTTGRRRTIQDAANGIFPRRVGVVLYARVDHTGAAEPVMADLRAYAIARDWIVVAKYHDLSTAKEHPGLASTMDVLRSGDALGVVAPNRTHLAEHRSGQRPAAGLLDTIDGAFVDYLEKASPVSGAPETTS